MIKWLLGVASLGLGLGLVGACGGDKDKDDSERCQTGSLGCFCYANETCNDGLQCVEAFGVCAPLGGGIGGAPGGDDDRGDEGGGPGDEAPGGAGPTTSGGSGNQAGSFAAGGLGSGGLGGGGNTAGTSGGGSTTNPFPDSPLGCALITSCPTCCETVGVYALDPLSNDATPNYVTSFEVTESSAIAEYDLQTTDDIGAIFFRFKTGQSISSLKVFGSGTGGSLEIALVRAGGKDGCIYPVVGGTLSPTPDTCWGLGAGPFAALSADQIELRVRSLLGGRAALNVTGIEFGS
jgi:hypothetical protein